MKEFIIVDINTTEVTGWGTMIDEAYTESTPIGILRIEVSNPQQYQYKYYLYNNTLVPYTPAELEARNNTPLGFIWKMPERILQDIRPLEQAKELKWNDIKKARGIKENLTFTFDSHVFHADKGHIGGATQLAILAKSANQAFSIDWTLYDNSVITLNADQMIAVGAALGNHVNSLYATARILRTQIMECTTNAEVDAIEWPT